MPCNSLRNRYDTRKTNQTITVAATQPFYKAVVKTLLVEKKIKFRNEVVKVVMKDRDTFKVYIRYKGYVTIKIDDLHDMAVLFLPKPDPKKPPTFADLANHFHPKAPKDLMDKPLQPEESGPWRWKAVGDIYVKEYYTPEKPVETPQAALKKKLIMRVIEVSEVTPAPAPIKQERVLQEEEVEG